MSVEKMMVAAVVAIMTMSSCSGDGRAPEEGGSSSEIAADITTTTVATTTTTTEPAEESTTSTTLYGGVADAAYEYELGEGLPDYVTEPRRYSPGTIEGDVEVAYVNSQVATMRSFAHPATEEPGVVEWKTGFALDSNRNLTEILVEERWRTVPGELTQIEVEQVSLVGDGTAHVEVCDLSDSTTYAIDDPEIQTSELVTQQLVMEMVLGAEGRWQVSELIEVLSEFEGIGECLDIEVVHLGEGADVE